MARVWADDIEIFFSPVTGADAQPNILLVLDASASMLSEDGTNTTRQERMNAAMGQVLNRINNVNIGVMRFSNRNSGGRVIYPVRDIETFLCDGAPCASTVDFEGSVTTARQEILDTILTMNTQWDTPTVGAMLEAEAYFVGAPVNFGKKRVAEPCPTRTGAWFKIPSVLKIQLTWHVQQKKLQATQSTSHRLPTNVNPTISCL